MEQFKIKDLLNESTRADSSMGSGATLQAFTRATRALIYEDLIAVQETNLPVAGLYGVRLLDSGGNMSYLSHATYSGMINSREAISEVSAKAYVKDELFKKDDIVYKTLVPFTLTGTEYSDINKEMIAKKYSIYV